MTPRSQELNEGIIAQYSSGKKNTDQEAEMFSEDPKNAGK